MSKWIEAVNDKAWALTCTEVEDAEERGYLDGMGQRAKIAYTHARLGAIKKDLLKDLFTQNSRAKEKQRKKSQKAARRATRKARK